MIKIYKKLIENYVNNSLSVQDIKIFAANNNINISNSESIIIYNYIKRNYKFILNDKNYSFNDLKDVIREDLYKEIIKLYTKYKSKLF